MAKLHVVSLSDAERLLLRQMIKHGKSSARLHDLQADLDAHGVYTTGKIDGLVQLYLSAAPREGLDVVLDACVEVYTTELDEEGQVDFKGKAKALATSSAASTTCLATSPGPTRTESRT